MTDTTKPKKKRIWEHSDEEPKCPACGSLGDQTFEDHDSMGHEDVRQSHTCEACGARYKITCWVVRQYETEMLEGEEGEKL